MKSIHSLILFILLAALDLFRRSTRVMANVVAGTVQAHDGSVTRTAEGAIAAGYLLVKHGTAPATQVATCGASDLPLGSVPCDYADGDNDVAVGLLARTRTHVLTASEAITAGTLVYTAAGGKVSTLSAVAATYYKVGRALTTAAADGDQIEVETCFPVATVVT